ncbi:MAG: DUF1648 domain-containing protein [Planctomycetota bacterium]|nr:MAG: DUF1648 domain-containing protein [Planctomycetota bacterium]
MRWSTGVLIAAVAASFGLALYWWPDVPARVPLHFDLAGAPDRYGERGYWSWFLLPTLAALFALFLGWLVPRWIDWLAERAPDLINIPHKQRFLQLSPEQRRSALRPVIALLQVLSCEVVLLFAWMQYATLQVARGAWTHVPTAFVFVVIAVLLATALGSVPLARRAVARAAGA